MHDTYSHLTTACNTLLRRHLVSILAVAALIALYGGSIATHIERSQSPWVFADDARQEIFPFHKYSDANALQDDYITDYYLNGLLPVGHRALFVTAAYFDSVALLSTVLPYILIVTGIFVLPAPDGPLSGISILPAGSGPLYTNTPLRTPDFFIARCAAPC